LLDEKNVILSVADVSNTASCARRVVIRHSTDARVCGGRDDGTRGYGMALSDVLAIRLRVPVDVVNEWCVKYAIDKYLVMWLEQGALAFCAVGRRVEVHI
jgi:hypothetical protein